MPVIFNVRRFALAVLWLATLLLLTGCQQRLSSDYVLSAFLSVTKQPGWSPKDVSITLNCSGQTVTFTVERSVIFQHLVPHERLSQGNYPGGVYSKGSDRWSDVSNLVVSYKNDKAYFQIQKLEQSEIGRFVFRGSSGQSYFYFKFDNLEIFLTLPYNSRRGHEQPQKGVSNEWR